MVDYIVGDHGVEPGESHPPHQQEDERKQRTGEAKPVSSPASSAQPPQPSGKSTRYSRWKRYLPHAAFALVATAYMVVSIATIGNDYIDFGDGNYLYISWRLMEGERLYRDVPSPQPPLHLLFGSFLLQLGWLPVVRAWQAVQHVLIACLVWVLGEELSRSKSSAALAGSIYLLLPEGFWWALGYQSEGLVLLLLTFGVVAYLRGVREGPWSLWILACGFSGCLALYTNMTAVVYLGLQSLAMFLTHRRHFFRGYLVSLAGPAMVLFVIFLFWSEGEYIRHVWSRQIASYPTGGFLQTFGYFFSKLLVEGGDIAEYEGALAALSVVGMLLVAGMDRESAHPERNYLVWWGMAGIGSILFATKGGTVEYIFTLGEPAVSVFCGFFIYTLLLGSDLAAKPAPGGPTRFWVGTRWLLLLAVLVPVLFWRAGQLIIASTARNISVIENPAEGVDVICDIIHERAPQKNQPILAPPHYAFIAQRPIAQNISELFLLGIAYFDEFRGMYQTLPPYEQSQLAALPQQPLPVQIPLDVEPRPYTIDAVRLLAMMVQNRPELRVQYPAIAQFVDVREQMMRQEIPIAVINVTHLITSVPLLQEALHNYYRPIDLQLPSRRGIIMKPNVLLGRSNYVFLEDLYDPERAWLATREERLRFYEPRRVFPQ